MYFFRKDIRKEEAVQGADERNRPFFGSASCSNPFFIVLS